MTIHLCAMGCFGSVILGISRSIGTKIRISTEASRYGRDMSLVCRQSASRRSGFPRCFAVNEDAAGRYGRGSLLHRSVRTSGLHTSEGRISAMRPLAYLA